LGLKIAAFVSHCSEWIIVVSREGVRKDLLPSFSRVCQNHDANVGLCCKEKCTHTIFWFVIDAGECTKVQKSGQSRERSSITAIEGIIQRQQFCHQSSQPVRGTGFILEGNHS
jgi:hypothetical protein